MDTKTHCGKVDSSPQNNLKMYCILVKISSGFALELKVSAEYLNV